MRIGRFQVSGTCWLRKDPVRRGKASTDSPSKCAMKCVERVDVELVGLRGDSWILRLRLQCLSSKTANYPLLIRSISTNDFYRHIQGTRWCGVKRCPNEVRYIKQRYHGFTYRISQQFRAIDYHTVCHQYHPITLTSRANPPAEHPPPEKPRKTSSSCLPPSSNPHNEVSVLPACSETQPALPICCSQ